MGALPRDRAATGGGTGPGAAARRGSRPRTMVDANGGRGCCDPRRSYRRRPHHRRGSRRGGPPGWPRMTTELDRAVLDYLSHLGVERGLAANTLTSYRRDLRRYVGHLAARGIDAPGAIAEADVLAFL